MFVDEKLKEWIERDKHIWQENKELLIKTKDLIKYFFTYEKDSYHTMLKDNFNEVLDNIEILAKTLNFNTGIELIMFCGYLIHNGTLSINKEYQYRSGLVDINGFLNDKQLYYALRIFSGNACCRHTAAFTKKVLGRFNIENNIAAVDTNEKDDNINEIKLFLHNFHKKGQSGTNHVINYINDNNISYFVDITPVSPLIFGAYKQFACSIDGNDFKWPIYSYNCREFDNQFVDYRNIPQITRAEASHLINTGNAAIIRCIDNNDLIEKCYFQNKEIYQKMNEAYCKIYEKEKSLRLI